MGFKVTYTDKAGKTGTATFPTRAIAEQYARGFKKATVEETGAAVPTVSVKSCPVGTAEAQKEATRAYFKGVKEPKNGRLVQEEPISDEQRFEQMAEHFGAARAAGQYIGDAWDDWDHINGR